MKNAKNILFLSALTAFLSFGCSGEPGNKAGYEELPSEEPPPEAGIEPGTPLFLKIGLKYNMDTASNFTPFKECKINASASAPSSMNCTVTVPEADLYYSDIKFDMGTLAPERCDMVIFQPYFYLRSTAKRFAYPNVDLADPDPNNPDNDADLPPYVDCSLRIKDKLCYGGAAPAIVTDFPARTGYISMSAVTASFSHTLISEHKTQMYPGFAVNYLAANNLTNTGMTVASGANKRRGGTWVNYSVTCVDRWYEPQFTIYLTIGDENVEPGDPGGTDHFTDWQ